MGIKELAVDRSFPYKIRFQDTEIKEGFNCRKDYGDIQQLKASILENGVQDPLKGYYDSALNKIIVTDGHRRHMAVSELYSEGHTEILLPFLNRSQGSNETDDLLDQIILNDGKPLTTLEQGEVFKRLLGYGWNVQKIAQKTGRNIATINNALYLLSQPQDVVNLVEEGSVSSTLAINVAREYGSDAGEILSDAVENASTRGKAKATQKDVDHVVTDAPTKRSPSLKSTVRDVFTDSQTQFVGDDVIVTISKDRYEELCYLAGVK